MQQIISIHIGQCGVQIGSALWELLTFEHCLSSDGKFEGDAFQDESMESFFINCRKNQFVPRVLFIDLEPNVIDEIKTGAYRKLFHPNQLINGTEDASNNFARGFHTSGRIIKNICQSRLRKEIEMCSRLQAIHIYRSLGGGTGSGMTATVFELLSEYFKTTKIEIPIHPSPHLCSAVVEPYNCILTEHYCMDDIDISLLMDNEALYDVVTDEISIKEPTFSNLNKIVAQICSSMTSSSRFSTDLYNDFTILTNLVPYPRIHYPLVSYAPFGNAMKIDKDSNSVTEITRSVFKSTNQLVKCDPSNGKYMSCSLLYRGSISPVDVYSALGDIKSSNSVHFVDWCPTGFKVGIVNQQPRILTNSQLGIAPRNVIMMTNNSAVSTVWHRLSQKFHRLYSKRSFVHWYVSEGLEENEFCEALFNIATLAKDYEEVSLDTVVENESGNTELEETTKSTTVTKSQLQNENQIKKFKNNLRPDNSAETTEKFIRSVEENKFEGKSYKTNKSDERENKNKKIKNIKKERNPVEDNETTEVTETTEENNLQDVNNMDEGFEEKISNKTYEKANPDNENDEKEYDENQEIENEGENYGVKEREMENNEYNYGEQNEEGNAGYEEKEREFDDQENKYDYQDKDGIVGYEEQQENDDQVNNYDYQDEGGNAGYEEQQENDYQENKTDYQDEGGNIGYEEPQENDEQENNYDYQDEGGNAGYEEQQENDDQEKKTDYQDDGGNIGYEEQQEDNEQENNYDYQNEGGNVDYVEQQENDDQENNYDYQDEGGNVGYDKQQENDDQENKTDYQDEGGNVDYVEQQEDNYQENKYDYQDEGGNVGYEEPQENIDQEDNYDYQNEVGNAGYEEPQENNDQENNYDYQNEVGNAGYEEQQENEDHVYQENEDGQEYQNDQDDEENNNYKAMQTNVSNAYSHNVFVQKPDEDQNMKSLIYELSSRLNRSLDLKVVKSSINEYNYSTEKYLLKTSKFKMIPKLEPKKYFKNIKNKSSSKSMPLQIGNPLKPSNFLIDDNRNNKDEEIIQSLMEELIRITSEISS